jgi:ParB family chromosome partitioning protein
MPLPRHPSRLSQKLVEELAVQRRDILAINLASNPAIALDYLIFAIADSRALYSAQALGTTLRAPSPSLYLANYPESPAHTLMADMRETLDLSWTEHRRTVDRFAAFSALDDDAKASWLAWCMAKTLEASMGIDKKAGQSGPEPIDLHDHLAALMGINVAEPLAADLGQLLRPGEQADAARPCQRGRRADHGGELHGLEEG